MVWSLYKDVASLASSEDWPPHVKEIVITAKAKVLLYLQLIAWYEVMKH